MNKEIIKGNQSNIEVKIILTEDDYKKLEEKAIRELGKDVNVPGFRPGKAPIADIKRQINEEYLKGAIYEEAINEALKDTVKEYQLIGQIYDINNEKKDNDTIITFKVDVYPEVEVKNENYNSVEPKLPEENVTKEDLNKAITGLKQQFAEYKDIETVNTEKSYTKLDLEYLDKDGNKVGDGKIFLAKQDYEEFPILKEKFDGKKVGDSSEFDYDEEKLPQLLKYFKKDKENLDIKKVKATISEIKEAVLPELTVENIEKWFGKKYEKIEDFEKEVEKTLEIEKRRNELGAFVDDLLAKIKDSFSVIIPKSLIDQEINQRLEDIKKRYGGADKFEQVLKSMKPEEVKKFYEDLTKAAKDSINNFLILMKYVDLKGLTSKIDFKKDLDLEEKLLELFKK